MTQDHSVPAERSVKVTVCGKCQKWLIGVQNDGIKHKLRIIPVRSFQKLAACEIKAACVDKNENAARNRAAFYCKK
jgi:hypothetical protein